MRAAFVAMVKSMIACPLLLIEVIPLGKWYSDRRVRSAFLALINAVIACITSLVVCICIGK